MTSEVIVTDSSCLIGLSRIARLDILRDLFESLLIPPAVFDEVVTKGAGRHGAEEVANSEWIVRHEIENQLSARTLRLSLGSGEAEAIVLASERKADYLILDDWNARKAAIELSLPVIGTKAILAKAAEKGIISDLPVALEELRKAGFWFPL